MVDYATIFGFWENEMRYLILAASALFIVASSSPTMARDYAWCARTFNNPYFGDCSFSSYQQCQATVSGQGGDCITNPRLSYGQDRYGRRGWRDNGLQDRNWR
jgi:hypothetical protein